MNLKTSILAVGIAVVAAGTAAGSVIISDPWREEFPIIRGGTLVIDNSVGNVEIVAGNVGKVVVSGTRIIRAADGAAANDAKRHVRRVAEGDERTRILRGIAPRTAQWTSAVNYSISVPWHINVRVGTVLSDRIRVAGVRGVVKISNLSGTIVVENVGNETVVDTANGNIQYISTGPLPANTRLTSVNGNIDVRVAAESKFVWESESVAGDARTAFGVHGVRPVRTNRYRGSINLPTNIVLITETFRGNVSLLPLGAAPGSTRSLREFIARVIPGPPVARPQGFSRQLVDGLFTYATSMGDVAIGEIRGDARIVTGAGEVRLGTVLGYCNVLSHGGPLNLGDVSGSLTAQTAAGDVVVQAARQGGTIETGGGTIRVNQIGGPTRLTSGGGDIVLREVNAPVSAETKSGDIQIAVTHDTKTQKLTGRTQKGNVVLTIPAGFAADIDAVILTSDPNAHSIRSELAGLAIQRDQVDGKTRIRASGKLNGGGEQVELFAQDGGIQITSSTARVSPALP